MTVVAASASDSEWTPAAKVSEEAERRLGPIRLWITIYVTVSIASLLGIFPDRIGTMIRLARWACILVTAMLVLGNVVHSRLSKQGAAWIVSAVYGLATAVYSIDLPSTVLRGASFLALTVAAFAGSFAFYSQGGAGAIRLTSRLTALICGLSFISLAGLITGQPAIFFHINGLFKGVFGHPNALGAFTSQWLVVLLAVHEGRFLRHRKTLVAGMIALAVCAVASRSRAGVGSSLIALMSYLLITRDVGRLFVGLMLCSTVLLSAFIMLPYASDEATRESADFIYKGGDEDVLVSRREVWETGWDNFFASPWIGHGFGTSVGEETREWKLVGLGGREKGNAVLAILEETGALGALVMCLPILLSLIEGFRIRRLNLLVGGRGGALRGHARLAAGFWAGVVGGLANNMAEATLWSPGLAFGGFLLFLAGAAAGLTAQIAETL